MQLLNASSNDLAVVDLPRGRLVVDVVRTSGSADLVSCARGNALAVTPEETTALAAGDPIDVLLLDDFDAR